MLGVATMTITVTDVVVVFPTKKLRLFASISHLKKFS